MRQPIYVSACVMVFVGALVSPLSAEERSGIDVSAAVRRAVVQASAASFLAEETAVQAGGGATSRDNEHQLGVGVRTGGYAFDGIGATVRSWFQPHLGVQIGVSHYGYGDFFGFSYSSTQFTPAVLYQFAPIKVNAPMMLRPYVGGGVSIIRSSFSYLNNIDTTDTAGLVLGGVEIFFDRVPRLGVSGELEFSPSASPYRLVGSVGGPGFVGMAHWYFR
jgi:hypothetical protein